MNYVRTSAGGMMPISFKNSTLKANKKQTAVIKPSNNSKNNSASKSK